MIAKLHKHYWALTKEFDPELIVVLCTREATRHLPADFYVCGPWKKTVSQVVLIKEIELPAEYRHLSLFYGIKTMIDHKEAPVPVIKDWEEIIQVNDLIEKYGYWNEHPKHTVADWIEEVQAKHTRLGYWFWVNGQIEQEGV